MRINHEIVLFNAQNFSRDWDWILDKYKYNSKDILILNKEVSNKIINKYFL